jgi:phage FluMu protein Com
MTDFCENEECDYKKVYDGEAASSIELPLFVSCPKCGEMLFEFMHAGISEIRCHKCNTIFIPEGNNQ